MEAGPFVAGLYPDIRNRTTNYATPLPGAEPTDQEVAELIAAFREHDLLPRLEFVPRAAPAVEAALRRSGFTNEAVHDYLICTPGSLAPPSPPAGIVRVVEAPAGDGDFVAIDEALSSAFEDPESSSPEGVARLRRTAATGGAIRFIRAADGTCAGAACSSSPAAGTAELWGIGTRLAHRGLGIAGTLTAAVAEAMFEAGVGSVWLEAADDGSRRVYERVGFAASGTRLYMALEG